MVGSQKRVSLKQIEGWPDKEDSTLIERLQTIDVNSTTYTFNQEQASTKWMITHSLKFLYPEVRVIDNDGNIIIGDINYLTENYLEIEFSIPTAGAAYIKK